MSETEDEIDLLDLFAVLVKWRKSIVKLMVFFVGVTVAVLFIAPSAGLVTFDSFVVRAAAVPVQLPPALSEELAIDSLKIAASIAAETRSVADALAESGYAAEIYSAGPQSGMEYQSFIKDRFIGKV
jgi:hypothetical protein